MVKSCDLLKEQEMETKKPKLNSSAYEVVLKRRLVVACKNWH